jgi:site-specific DNA-methyltransferase (adenine-specific)
MEKPVSLLRELVEMSSTFGDLVLDPYMGSGSTGVAALLEGRRFVGIEKEASWFDIACMRLVAAEAAWLAQGGL